MNGCSSARLKSLVKKSIRGRIRVKDIPQGLKPLIILLRLQPGAQRAPRRALVTKPARIVVRTSFSPSCEVVPLRTSA